MKINKFNNIVPLMEKQMVHYDAKHNIQKVLDAHHDFLPKDDGAGCLDAHISTFGLSQNQEYPADERIKWGEVWTNIKELFRNR